MNAFNNKRIKYICYFICTITLVSHLLILYRVALLQKNPNPKIAFSSGNTFSQTATPTTRNNLADKKGRILATTIYRPRIFIDPQDIEDMDLTTALISSHIKKPFHTLKNIITNSKSKRYIPINPPIDELTANSIRKLGLKGIGFESAPIRIKPHGLLASNIIGNTGSQLKGLSGLEYSLNNYLEEPSKRITWLRDGRKRVLKLLEISNSDRNDSTIRCTLDLRVQSIAEEELSKAVNKYNAAGGRVVVVDPTMGEILAMADIVRNPTGLHGETLENKKEKSNPNLSRLLPVNRCLSTPYEPGSTFKPFIWASLTQKKYCTPSELLQTPSSGKYITSSGRIIRDAHPYDSATWEKTLIKSINSGMAIVANRTTHHEMQSIISQWGFGTLTRCGLQGETCGIITNKDNWNDYSQLSVSMGHEIAVTPLQMVRAFSTFARDGTMPELTLKFSYNRTKPILSTRVIDKKTARLTREILHKVMTEGTGRHVESGTYKLFGKSGTAQLPQSNGKGYHQNRYISSFIAGAPLENPSIVAICVIDDPDRSKGHYGGIVAGPAVGKMIERILEDQGISRDQKIVFK